MTRKILLILLNFVLVGHLSAQEASFLDRIVDHFECRNCYFLVVDVETKPYSGKVIIENDELYGLLSATKGMNKLSYGEFIKRILRTGESLDFQEATLSGFDTFVTIKDLSEYQFTVVRQDTEVEDIARLGCIAFIKHYFMNHHVKSLDADNGDCKQFISKQSDNLLLGKDAMVSQDAIIAMLFKWSIAVRRDDISGFLTIDGRSVKRLQRSEL